MTIGKSLKKKRFNVIETAGTLLLGASILSLFLTIIGIAPLKFGALFLSIGIIISIFLIDTEKIDEGGKWEGLALIGMILTLFGSIGAIIGAGEYLGVLEQLASEKEIIQGQKNGLYTSAGGIFIGSILFALGETVKEDG